MANIALDTADRVEVVEALEQMSAPAGEAIEAGQAVRIDTAGKFTGSNGTTTTENRIYGIALRSCAAGEAVTALKHGVLDGYNVSAMAYDAPIYLSDTDGQIATTAGTVSTIVGRVIPGWSQLLGVAADKLVLIDL